MKTLYAVAWEPQQEQIAAWCWGKGCGKGSIGSIDLGVCTAIPCWHKDCPHLERDMDRPLCVTRWPNEDGEEVEVVPRKLRHLHAGGAR